MCGIAGIFNWGLKYKQHQQKIDTNSLVLMKNVLRRRGPDAQQILSLNQYLDIVPNILSNSQNKPVFNGDVFNALIHTRLAIIDTHEVANQPMSDVSGMTHLVFNGEIYNWVALRGELEGNYNFQTNSDSEVLIAGFLAWGFNKLLQKIEGMFAIAILDKHTHTLYLARDRLGKKPLLYHAGNGADSSQPSFFAFGSMVSALLPVAKYFSTNQRGINPVGVDAYLSHRTIFAPHTLYRGINRLPAAHAIEVDLLQGKHKIYSYWSAQAGESLILQDVWQEAVQTRLSSDRPVGIFLSGGIDSAVVANAVDADKRSAITTFTAGFSEAKWDESTNAADTAKYLGYQHKTIPINPNLRDDFSKIIADFDEPFADPSALPMWYLSREAANDIKVVLGGDGGDEFFGGYKRYVQHLRGQGIANFFGGGLQQDKKQNRLDNIPSQLLSSARQRLAYEFNLRLQNPLSAYALRFSGITPWQRNALYQGADINLYAELKNAKISYWVDNVNELHFPHNNDLQTLMAIDQQYYLPEYILRKGDLATMAHGLEMRQPLLDQNFISALLSQNQKSNNHPKQWLLNTLPDELAHKLQNSPKRGFNPPIRDWINKDLVERLPRLGERIHNACPWINKTTIDELVRVFHAPAKKSEKYHHGKMPERIFQLLVLDEFI